MNGRQGGSLPWYCILWYDATWWHVPNWRSRCIRWLCSIEVTPLGYACQPPDTPGGGRFWRAWQTHPWCCSFELQRGLWRSRIEKVWCWSLWLSYMAAVQWMLGHYWVIRGGGRCLSCRCIIPPDTRLIIRNPGWYFWWWCYLGLWLVIRCWGIGWFWLVMVVLM